MKIKYSALVSGVSGKLNGSVGATNRGGAYLRNKGVVTNPQTVSQQANRSLFGSISSQFRSLTPSQIAAWNAASVNFPYTDRFGDVRYLSGNALFVQLNKNLADAGLPPILDPPAKQTFPNIVSVVLAAGRGALPEEDLVNVQVDSPDMTTGFTLMAYTTGNLSPSISYVKNRLRLLDTQLSVTAANQELEMVDKFTVKFGRPVVGQSIKGEFRLVSNVSGEASAAFPFEGVVGVV